MRKDTQEKIDFLEKRNRKVIDAIYLLINIRGNQDFIAEDFIALFYEAGRLSDLYKDPAMVAKAKMLLEEQKKTGRMGKTEFIPIELEIRKLLLEYRIVLGRFIGEIVEGVQIASLVPGGNPNANKILELNKKLSDVYMNFSPFIDNPVLCMSYFGKGNENSDAVSDLLNLLLGYTNLFTNK